MKDKITYMTASEFLPYRIKQLKELISKETNILIKKKYQKELKDLEDPGLQIYFGQYKNWK